MNKTIKENVNSYLDTFELSDQQLSAFDDLENKLLEPEKPKYIKITIWSMAASVLVVSLFLNGLLSSFGTTGKTQESLIYAIASEVSYNHLKLKPLEVANTQLSQVTEYFKKLDFNPLASSQVASLSNRLIGGRYCSIKGNIAAQLRMQDDKGVVSTLFESRFNAEDFDFLPKIENQEDPVSVHVDGQQVKIWVEKGLVMALVNPI